MSEPIRVERRDLSVDADEGRTLTIEQDKDVAFGSRPAVWLLRDVPDSHADGQHAIALTVDELHWLVTTGGPAMITLLGGPIEGRGIERVGVPRG